MDATDAERDDRLHPASLRQGGGSVIIRRFVALAGLPMNCCESAANLSTCFILGLAGEVCSLFDWGDLPQTLAGAIRLALDFEAMGHLGPASLWRVAPRESSLVSWVPISVGPTHWFSAPSQIPSPPSRVGCIALVLDPGPGPAHVLPPEPSCLLYLSWVMPRDPSGRSERSWFPAPSEGSPYNGWRADP